MAPVLSLNVIPTVSENDGELRDIRSQADLPPQSLLPLIVSASVVGALVISLLIWVTYLLIERKVLSPRRSARALDTRSPYEIALDELVSIETLDLPLNMVSTAKTGTSASNPNKNGAANRKVVKSSPNSIATCPCLSTLSQALSDRADRVPDWLTVERFRLSYRHWRI